MRVLTKADGNALARYCKLWSRWRAAEKFLDKHGTTYDGDGGLRSYPQVRESSMLVGHLARLEQQFGLTPAARARLIAIDTGSAGKGEPKSKKRFFSTG